MRKIFFLLAANCLLYFANAQSVGIGTTTPDASAALDIKSINKGLLIPTITLVQRNAISNPATGLLVFQNDGLPGFYYNSGSPDSPAWTALGTAGSGGWQLGGNSGTNPAINFIGTADDAPLQFRINNVNAGFIDSTRRNTGIGFRSLDPLATGYQNTAFGYGALRANTTGGANTATGYEALNSNNSGSYNTAIGFSSLYRNTTGTDNSAVGYRALRANTTGSNNVANGSYALYSNITGGNNAANGIAALYYNTTGSNNTANGSHALFTNTTGYANTANGKESLYYNTTGSNNTANGSHALFTNTTGSNNLAIGYQALFSNTTGYSNIALGTEALMRNTTGTNNIAIGDSALLRQSIAFHNTAVGSKALLYNATGSGNTATGYSALNWNTTGRYNTAVGAHALGFNIAGSLNTAIGYAAGPGTDLTPSNFTALGYGAGRVGGNSNTVEIGNSSITWIGGQVNWSTYSDESIKDDIKADVPGLAFIKKLRPVSYRLNIHRQNKICGIEETTQVQGKYQIENKVQTGFLAQEVERAAKEINYNFSGVTAPTGNAKLYSLSYAEFVVPLVKAVQEQQQSIEALQKQVDELVREIKVLREKPNH